MRRRARTEFRAEFSHYSELARENGFMPPSWDERIPCLHDRLNGMAYEPHYTYHCAWACRVIAAKPPQRHIDVSSSLQFVAMLSAWVPVLQVDIRVPKIVLSGLETSSGDLLALPFDTDAVDSLSCLHVIEHIGLGRYGDRISPTGDRLAADELSRVLAVGGRLLIAAPVGRPRTNFNAHRVYSYSQVLALFPKLSLLEFTLVPDDFEQGMIADASPSFVDAQEWGCGCFVFTKRKS